MISTDNYVALITSEHAEAEKFIQVVRALTSGFASGSNTLESMPDKYDIDTAGGHQLDTIGLWVGIGRRLRLPITGVYLTWDGTVATGWGSGLWQGPFDPTTGLVSLPDDVYRVLIRGKIAANSWDGTIPGAAAVWATVFNGGQLIIIQDNQDMSMIVGFVGPPLAAVEVALLTGGYLPLKPAGVRIAYYAVPVNDGPLFGWGASSPELAGWGVGSWAQIIIPT